MSKDELSLAQQEELNKIEQTLQTLSQKELQETEFAKKANLQFETNILAFEKYFPEIAEKFNIHTPDDKFNLFLNSNGSPNFIDYDTGVPIYGDDPQIQSSNQVREMFANPVLGRVDHADLEFIENVTNFVHIDLMREIGKVYNEARSTLPINKSVKGTIPSAIIFGVGLGFHLNFIFENMNAAYISIFEPNEDYFYASLFTFDWDGFLNRVDNAGSFLYFSIGIQEDEMYEALYNRADEIGAFSVTSALFFQHYPSKAVNKLIAEFKQNYHQFFMGWGFFDDALLSIAHTVKNMSKSIKLLNTEHKISKNISEFPIFIVANGPSLDVDILTIKSFKEKVIIVSCNSASTSLIKNGITPDFHVALERTKATEDFIKAFITEENRKKINLLVLNVMYPDVLDSFGWCGVALKGNEAGTSLFHIAEYIQNKRITPTIGFCNPLVGNTALSFFGTMLFKNIYLFGSDSGYKDPDHHHSKGSYYYSKGGETIHKPLKMGGDLVIPGNFGGTVLTDGFMNTGKVQMERFIESTFGHGINFYNCSDGALIKGAIPLASSDILINDSLLSKTKVIEYIKQSAFSKRSDEIDLNGYLGFDYFTNICKTITDFLEPEVYTREQALLQLLTSLRYLFSFKQSPRLMHLCLLLEGESLYVSSVLISLLYNFGEDDEIIPYYQRAKKLWKDFVSDAPQQYRDRWDELSDYSFDYSKPSV